jgi:hypothetical protein
MASKTELGRYSIDIKDAETGAVMIFPHRTGPTRRSALPSPKSCGWLVRLDPA